VPRLGFRGSLPQHSRILFQNNGVTLAVPLLLLLFLVLNFFLIF
jgi:hypothetical protein